MKPANLVLTPEGRVVLVDFGISRRPRTTSGPALGSPGYSAPELASGDALTPAADVYGLAATAVALLTGSPPVGGRPEWEGVPNAPAIERALRRGLAVDPSRRPRTAVELVERLRAHVSLDYPTGVVTFMLTDIEGSTALWESDPDGMADRLVAHDEIVADAVESNGGRLLKARGEGDSTFSVFTRASDAVAAALVDAARPRRDRPPGADRHPHRRGAGPGRRLLRAGREPRLAAAGHRPGGQVLLSAATAELAMETLPDGAHLTDLGFRELRDLSRGEQVFALNHVDLSPVAPTRPMAPSRGRTAAPSPSPTPPGARQPGRPATAPRRSLPTRRRHRRAPLPQPVSLARHAAPERARLHRRAAAHARAPPAPPLAGAAGTGAVPAGAGASCGPTRSSAASSERARLQAAWDDVVRGLASGRTAQRRARHRQDPAGGRDGGRASRPGSCRAPRSLRRGTPGAVPALRGRARPGPRRRRRHRCRAAARPAGRRADPAGSRSR